ncbi:MAG: ABC transporter substrate-binding protein, partial [Acidilobaceae archaeon]
RLGERSIALEERIARIEAQVLNIAESLGYPMVLRDWSGRDVVLLKPPRRVVSLAPSVTESVYYIGALETLVGVDEFSNFPPVVVELREKGVLRSIGGFWNPSIELVVALRPDLVVGLASVPSHVALRDIVSSYGIPVVLLGDRSLDEVIESLIVLGLALGKHREAYELAWRIRYAILELREIVGKAGVSEKPSVALIVWIEPLWVAGSKTWQHDLMSVAGLRNVYEDLESWQPVSPETLLKLNPSMILLTTSHGYFSSSYLISYLESTLGRSAWQIAAVREGRVVELSGFYEDSLVRPSPRLLVAVLALAVVGYPHVFGLNQTPTSLGDDFDLLSVISRVVSPTTYEIVEYIVRARRAALALAPAS